MFGHVRFQDGNMYTEQIEKLTLNGISNTRTPYEGIWQQSGAFCVRKNNNIRTACTAPAHTYLIHGFTVCMCLPTSFRRGGNRLSLWCWQDCILIESR